MQVHEADACLVLANKYCPDPDAEVGIFYKMFILYFAWRDKCWFSGCCEHYESDIHQELLRQHQSHHPADAVSQQGGQMQNLNAA